MSAGKKIGAGVLALIVVICGWSYAAPYITLYQMKKAIKAQDAVAISDHVNFPALRESLKGSFAAAMGKGEVAKESNNPFGALGAALATAFIGPMVDALVTPEAIAAMMQGEKPSLDKIDKEQQSHQTNKDDPQFSMGYETLSRFVVRTKNKENPKEEMSFIFTRDGLAWKLSAVRLPL